MNHFSDISVIKTFDAPPPHLKLLNFYIYLALFVSTISLVCGCGKKSHLEPLKETFSLEERVVDTAQISIYWDATPSMKGYLYYKGNQPYTQLPKLLYAFADRGLKPDFYRFGEQPEKVNSPTPYLDILNPAFYGERKNRMGAVIDNASVEHLTIIVSDLFEDKEDWVPIVSKVRNKYLSQGKAVLVAGFKNPFNGYIYDIGGSSNTPSIRYDSKSDETKFRPFYLLILGSRRDAETFRSWLERESKSSGWAMETLFFTKELSSPLATLESGTVTDTDGLSEMGALVDEGIIGELAKDFRINNGARESRLTLSVKHNALPARSRLDGDYICNITVKKSTPAGGWEESKEGVKLVSCEGLKVDNAAIKLDLNIAFGPTIEAQNVYMFLDIAVKFKEDTLKLPPWVDEWSAGASERTFDGTKTLNLKALLTELKNAAGQQQSPQMARIMAVFTPRNTKAKLKNSYERQTEERPIQQPEQREGQSGEFQGLITSVTDGDTLTVRTALDRTIHVRLFGIDAPEKDQPYGAEAKELLADLCLNSDAAVNLIAADMYKRVIGVVHCKGENANLKMLSNGMAWVYEEFMDKESREIKELFYSTEKSAKDNKIGLWRASPPLMPAWEWRKRR